MFRYEMVRNALIASVFCVFFAGASQAETDKPFFENNVNRWGADYSVFEIEKDGANACYRACAKDKQCLAWTFHRPGTKGKLGECHLKSKVAEGRSNPCCISGVLVDQVKTPAASNRPAKVSYRTSFRGSSGSHNSAQMSRAKKGFFRKANLSQGEAVGLPELSVDAVAPPLKITPLSFSETGEF